MIGYIIYSTILSLFLLLIISRLLKVNNKQFQEIRELNIDLRETEKEKRVAVDKLEKVLELLEQASLMIRKLSKKIDVECLNDIRPSKIPHPIPKKLVRG